MKEGLVPSPYGPSHKQISITKEKFESIMKDLGVESMLLVVEAEKNDCNGTNCLGHITFFRSEGFNVHNLGGIGMTVMDYSQEISESNQKMP